MVEIMGLTPEAEGSTLASAHHTPWTPRTAPEGSHVPSPGREDMRHEPIWCALPNALEGVASTCFAQAAKSSPFL